MKFERGLQTLYPLVVCKHFDLFLHVASEAFEEAGVTGDHNERPLGMYIYEKPSLSGESYPCLVTVFSLEVKKVLPDYPEKAERQREWFNRLDTLKRVKEPELKLLIKTFNPT